MSLPETYGTFSTAYVDAMRLRLSALEMEAMRLRLSALEAEAMRLRLSELEAESKKAREDEEWAHRHAVPIHRRGDAWVAGHFDGHRILEAEAASITEAIRALREKMENTESKMGGAR